MRVKYLLGAAMLTCAAAAPAFADSFYVVPDTATKKCTVVSQKPDDDHNDCRG